MFVVPVLQILDSLGVWTDALLIVLGILASSVFSYLALKRTPVLPTQMQKDLAELKTDFSKHVAEDVARFSLLSDKLTELKAQNALAAGDMKTQISTIAVGIEYIKEQIKQNHATLDRFEDTQARQSIDNARRNAEEDRRRTSHAEIDKD